MLGELIVPRRKLAMSEGHSAAVRVVTSMKTTVIFRRTELSREGSSKLNAESGTSRTPFVAAPIKARRSTFGYQLESRLNERGYMSAFVFPEVARLDPKPLNVTANGPNEARRQAPALQMQLEPVNAHV